MQRKRTGTPLFLPNSSDDNLVDANKHKRPITVSAEQPPQEDDYFVLDYTLFDIVPNTPDLTKDESTREVESLNSRLSDQFQVLSSDKHRPENRLP